MEYGVQGGEIDKKIRIQSRDGLFLLKLTYNYLCSMAVIQYCSDLHLEFGENKSFLEQHPIEPVGDILILAGDIVLFSLLNQFDLFFDELSEKFKMVYWIPGNHEYYHSDIQLRTGDFCEEIRNNVLLINNYTTQFDNVKLIFSTLWTHLSENNQQHIQQRLSDFHVISQGSNLFTPSYYNRLYLENMEFLRKAIKDTKDDESTVVVTHHVPTLMNYPEKYKGDILNEAFSVEMFDFIESNSVNYWIYGHHHCNIPSFNICKTQLLTNQLGYVKYGEHANFSPAAKITLL